MRLTRTIRLPISATPNDVLPSLVAYTKAFNLVCQVGWADSDSNGISLHHKTYAACKALGLPSQLACSARVKATEALLSVKARLKKGKRASCPRSRLCPIRLDARSLNVWFAEDRVTIRLADKRSEFKLKIPKFYEPFVGWRQKSADLVVKNGKVFLHMVVENDAPDPVPAGRVVGVDVGIKRTAVTSQNKFFGGGVLSRVALKFRNTRRQLQKKGHSGKRHLVSLHGRENRFVGDMLHRVSKWIVAGLNPGDVLAMEDLDGIRDHGLGKKSRTMLNAWAFGRLQFMLRYKAEAKGCLVVMVDPKHTSQRCSRCGHVEKGNRKHQGLFECKKCHFTLNADLNGSRNIALRGEMPAARRGGHGLPPTSLMLPAV
jgi:IS605 OrfB family transposase